MASEVGKRTLLRQSNEPSMLNLPDCHVSLTERGARVPVVLARLASQCGRDLASAQEFDNRVLTVWLVQAPLSETLDRIAYVLDAEWQESEAVFRLVPSLAIEQQVREARRSRMTAAARNSIAKFRDLNDVGNEYDDERVRQSILNTQARDRMWNEKRRNPNTFEPWLEPIISPGLAENRLLARLLSFLPDEIWPAFQDNDRVVYANYPTPAQREFPSGWQTALEQYREEWKTCRRLGAVPREYTSTINPSSSRDLEDLPAHLKVHLVLWMDFPADEQIHMRLRVMDLNGEELAFTGKSLESANPPGESVRYPTMDAHLPAPGVDLIVLDSEDERRLKDFFGSQVTVANFGKPRPVLPTEWLERALDPFKFEHLGVLQGTKWLAYADHLQVNLVGSPVDTVQKFLLWKQELAEAPGETPTVSKAYDLQSSPGWLTIKAPFEISQPSVNRSVLRTLLENIRKANMLSIEEATEYIQRVPRLIAYDLWDDEIIDRALREDGMGGVGIGNPSAFDFQLWAALSNDQRRLLRTEPIAFCDLSPAALEYLTKWAYSDHSFQMNEVEPTDVLPDGLRMDGQLRLLKEERETIVVALTEDGGPLRSLSSELGPYALAELSLKALENVPELEAAKAARRFRIGEYHRIDFEARFCDELKLPFNVEEISYSPRVFADYDELPADFRNAVEALKQRNLETEMLGNDI